MINKKIIKDFIYWVSIFIVSASMLIYGLSKPFQFGSIENSKNISQLSGQQLMWVFYNHSKFYPIIIGIFEIMGAITLLFNKTRVLGCLILTTILFNIIIQDYVFNVVALSSAIYYQVLIIIILICEKTKVKFIFDVLFSNYKKQRANILIIVIALIVALILKIFETKIM